MLRGTGTAALALTTVALAFSFGACGDPEPYDVSCKVDGDCAIVPVKPGCGCDQCSNTVINKKEVSRYNEDRQDEDDCSDFGAPCARPGGGACPTQTPFCTNGRCALR